MSQLGDSIEQKQYWTDRYQNNNTGWDIGYPSTPIKAYIDQLEDKDIKILIPGAGNAYEAEYLFELGFTSVHILDIAKAPLERFAQRVPNFPFNQMILSNFMEHEGQYDLIIEQTFFCSFVPSKENRRAYAKKMSDLLKPEGKLVGLWFDFPLTDDLEKRPFGGDKHEYISYFESYFEVKVFEKCYNSIPPRQGKELFAILKKS